MLSALVLMLAAQMPPMPDGAGAPKGPPPAIDSSRLYFLAGELRKAGEVLERCVKLKENKQCAPLKRTLIEYTFLASRRDEMTPVEAAQFIALDHEFSPAAQGKITHVVYERFVTGPLRIAQSRAQGGDLPGALALVEGALAVDPKNVDALKLKADSSRGPDAGLPGDAGTHQTKAR